MTEDNKDAFRLIHRDDLPFDLVEKIEQQFAETHPGMKVCFAGDMPDTPENRAMKERF